MRISSVGNRCMAWLSVVGVAACSQPTGTPSTNFEAGLGANEVPAVTTTASGIATMSLSGTTISYSIKVNNLNNPVQAHIHAGSPSASGPVRFWLCGGGGQPDCATGTPLTGTLITATNSATTGAITMDSLLVLMRNGNAYVNVHTTANPGGEIRGQVVGSN
jgi:hypothetical protein